MTTIGLTHGPRPIAVRRGVIADKVRSLIAEFLYVDVESLTDEAHFADDLGADSLDCLELMIAIEDHFPGVQIADSDFDRIVAIGDLIRHVEGIVEPPPLRRAFNRSMPAKSL